MTVVRVGALSDVITHPPQVAASRLDRPPKAAVDEQPAMATTTASNSRPAKPHHPRSAQGRPKTSVMYELAQGARRQAADPEPGPSGVTHPVRPGGPAWPVVRAPSASSALSALLVMLMALLIVIVLTTVWLALG